VAEANLMTGFACNDRPWVGMTALITSSDGVATARAHAATLAR
jgi:putative transposase